MKTRRNKPVTITDAPERHYIAPMEFRDDSEDENVVKLSGYASTFEPYEMYGGPAQGGWIEQIARGAFEKTLREKPDLHLLVNHAGMPLARTKSGTLKLSVDDHGLRVDAELDRRDPEVQALEVKMRRGDMDEMSFAFRVKAQEWEATADFPDDDMALRTITEVSLHKGDVSVVNFGANPTTSASVRSVEEALKIIAECGADELAEARGEGDLLRQAQEKLGVNAQDASIEVENLNVDADDTLRWLHAELEWRANVLEWLHAERGENVVVAMRLHDADSPFVYYNFPHNADGYEVLFDKRSVIQSAELFTAAATRQREADPAGIHWLDVEKAELQRRRAEDVLAPWPTPEEIDAIIAAENTPKRGMSLRLAKALAGE